MSAMIALTMGLILFRLWRLLCPVHAKFASPPPFPAMRKVASACEPRPSLSASQPDRHTGEYLRRPGIVPVSGLRKIAIHTPPRRPANRVPLAAGIWMNPRSLGVLSH